MTSLCDTHAHAWKIEGVVDKLARAIKKKTRFPFSCQARFLGHPFGTLLVRFDSLFSELDFCLLFGAILELK